MSQTTAVLITSSLNLFLHILGAYLLISVYKKGKKTVQQLLLINLSITELETSVGMVEDGVSVAYTNGSSCNSNNGYNLNSTLMNQTIGNSSGNMNGSGCEFYNRSGMIILYIYVWLFEKILGVINYAQ